MKSSKQTIEIVRVISGPPQKFRYRFHMNFFPQFVRGYKDKGIGFDSPNSFGIYINESIVWCN